MKRLIVTADDFGLCPGVVRGIIASHQRGIVTATSLMVNAPAAEEAARWARSARSLAVGLHFVLTFGEPVGPREPLGELVTPDGRFRALAFGAHERARASQVREELAAQLRRFEQRVGRPPAHIDGHHHVHEHPEILGVAIEQARRLGVPVRARSEATRERLRREAIATADAFVEEFYGEDVGEEALARILERLPDGTTELMCHPAEEDAALGSLSSYVQPRYRELRALTSPRIRDAVARAGIELLLPERERDGKPGRADGRK